MSTLAEIEAAIAQLPPAQRTEIRRWMDAHEASQTSMVTTLQLDGKLPDFLSRQRAVFGDRILQDSQTLLEEARQTRL